MRCKACNVMLDEFEAKKKDKSTGEYLDLCSGCRSVSEQSIWELSEERVDYSIKPEEST